MTNLAFLVRRPLGMGEPRIPEWRGSERGGKDRRRMEDEIEAIFKKARAGNCLEEAADLLVLLEKWHTKRTAGSRRERHGMRESLRRARSELERLGAFRDAPSGGSAT